MAEVLTVIAHATAKPGKIEAARTAMRALVGPTKAEPGCIDYELHQSEGDPAKFVFYENWTSVTHLDAHAKSAHIQAFRKLVPEILAGPVEISKWKKVVR